jgi:hypothetical protein
MNLKTAVLTTAGTANTAKNMGFKLFLSHPAGG